MRQLKTQHNTYLMEASWFHLQRAVNISDEVNDDYEEKLYHPS